MEVSNMEKMNVIKRAYIASAYSSRKKKFLKCPNDIYAEKLSESVSVKAHGWFSRKKDPVPLLMETAKLLVDNKSKSQIWTLADEALTAIASNPKSKANLLFELVNWVSLVDFAEPSKAPWILERAMEIAEGEGKPGMLLELASSKSNLFFSGTREEKKNRVGSIIGALFNMSDLHIPNAAVLDFAKILVKNGFGKDAVTLIRQAIYYANSSRYGSSRSSDNWAGYVAYLAGEGTVIVGKYMHEKDWKSIGDSIARLAYYKEIWHDNGWQSYKFLAAAKELAPKAVVDSIVEDIQRALPESEHERFRKVFEGLA